MSDRHRFPVHLFRLVDLVLVSLSLGISSILIARQQVGISLSHFLALRTRISTVLLFVVVLILFHWIFSICGLYKSRRLSTRLAEQWDVLKAVTVAIFCLALVGSLFSVEMIRAYFIVLFWLINAVLLCGSRLVLRAVLARIRSHGKNIRNMLVLGTNPRAVDFAQRLIQSPQRGYRILGFVDDEWPGLNVFTSSGFSIVSDFSGLTRYLRDSVIDEITVYLPLASFYAHCNQVATLCQQHGIIMRFSSDPFGLKSEQHRAEVFDGEHFITASTRMPEGIPVAIKRILDVIVSAVLLLLLSPVLLVTALAIKLTSPGPVLFLQERIGLSKRRFKIFKLRTMVTNAELLMEDLEKNNEASGPVFKIKKDPRITSIGKFLRASSIDELPQLINVLKGDMSLVGPRPLPVRDFQGFNLDWQRRRFSVKPGITCLWQVAGRSTVSFEQWMLLDLQYMDQWSVWLDIKILLQTIPAVLRGSGAM